MGIFGVEDYIYSEVPDVVSLVLLDLVSRGLLNQTNYELGLY